MNGTLGGKWYLNQIDTAELKVVSATKPQTRKESERYSQQLCALQMLADNHIAHYKKEG
jgi:hypothetical protein